LRLRVVVVARYAHLVYSGKVFVFSGLLRICNDEDGLATVLGHEIAHNIAHHAAENYSRISFLLPIAYALSFAFDVSNSITFTLLDYAYNKPGSRRQEVGCFDTVTCLWPSVR